MAIANRMCFVLILCVKAPIAMASSTEAVSPHVMNTYGRVPIALSHGQGCASGTRMASAYLDALGGIAVNTLGHNHPKLVPALQDQIAKLIHSSNYYHVPGQEALAAKLVELSGMTNVFFCSTGLEANEAAIKLARKFGHDKGIERPEIVVYENAFHGRSIATLSATGNAKVQRASARWSKASSACRSTTSRRCARQPKATPTSSPCSSRPSRAKAASIRCAGTTCAGARALRRARLAADDRRGAVRHGPHRQVVRAPVGRHPAGRDAAGQGPGLGRADRRGGGRPASRASFQPGNHGTTFGGNPLAMRAGIETIRIMEEDGLLENAATVGAHLKAALERELLELPGVLEVRGQGLMLGIELDRPCGALTAAPPRPACC